MLNKSILASLFPYLQGEDRARQVLSSTQSRAIPQGIAPVADGMQTPVQTPVQANVDPLGTVADLTSRQPEILTLGGTQEVPFHQGMQSDTAQYGQVRPIQQMQVQQLQQLLPSPQTIMAPMTPAIPVSGNARGGSGSYYGPPEMPNATPEQQAQAALDFWQKEREHPTNRDKGWKGLIKEIAENFLYGMGQTQPGMSWRDALVLGGTGAAGGFFNKGWNEQRRAEQEIPIAQQRLQTAMQQTAQNAQIENMRADNEYKQASLAERRADREARVHTARLNEVGRQLRALPYIDVNDPKFKDILKSAGDLDLPVTSRDAKKKVDLKQDQRSGEWTVILTDPVTGKQDTRPVMKDGKPFASTPEVVMQGEYVLSRQNDQQAFTASENEKKRQFDASENQKDRAYRSAMEAGKVQARLAFKQLEQAMGTQAAIAKARQEFIDKYRKQYNDAYPSEAAINQYLSTVQGIGDDDQ